MNSILNNGRVLKKFPTNPGTVSPVIPTAAELLYGDQSVDGQDVGAGRAKDTQPRYRHPGLRSGITVRAAKH